MDFMHQYVLARLMLMAIGIGTVAIIIAVYVTIKKKNE